jgi:hypothetical protein
MVESWFEVAFFIVLAVAIIAVTITRGFYQRNGKSLIARGRFVERRCGKGHSWFEATNQDRVCPICAREDKKNKKIRDFFAQIDYIEKDGSKFVIYYKDGKVDSLSGIKDSVGMTNRPEDI